MSRTEICETLVKPGVSINHAARITGCRASTGPRLLPLDVPLFLGLPLAHLHLGVLPLAAAGAADDEQGQAYCQKEEQVPDGRFRRPALSDEHLSECEVLAG